MPFNIFSDLSRIAEQHIRFIRCDVIKPFSDEEMSLQLHQRSIGLPKKMSKLSSSISAWPFRDITRDRNGRST